MANRRRCASSTRTKRAMPMMKPKMSAQKAPASLMRGQKSASTYTAHTGGAMKAVTF